MKTILSLLLGFLLLAVDTCSNENKKNEKIADAQSSINQAMEQTGMKAAEKFNGKLNELLTLDMTIRATNYKPDQVEIEYDTFSDNPRDHSLTYSWDHGRVVSRDLGFMSIELPDKDMIQLSWVAATTYEDFERNYRPITKEDLERANKAMEEHLNKSDLSEEAGNMARGLLGDLSQMSINREWIDGVADAAVWIEGESSLKVFHKGLMFSLYANTGAEKAKERQLVLNLARMMVHEKL
jgi:hypothetical protein